MILRLLNPQGIAGIAVSLALALLLLLQSGETRHWKTQSAHFEELYAGQQSALAATVANYRAAAAQAQAEDRAAVEQAEADQRSISERTKDDFEARIAAARARAQQLRVAPASATADPGLGGPAPVRALSAAAVGSPEAAGQGRLPAADALTATEQAIQLDALINWVKAQARVKAGGAPQ